MSASSATICLTHNFLIAMPAMTDPNFARTLTYICEHNEQGALGVIINRPMNLDLATLFERVNIPFDVSRQHHEMGAMPIYYGGPVQTDRGFVLHRPLGAWQSTLVVQQDMDIGLTSTRDILVGIGANGQPADILVSLGYAGWSAGQLEWELAQNAWLNVPADPRIIFELPAEERLTAAMQLLGIDFANLSDVAGHA
ncbi:MAG: YqgE/AlgH family protein [Sterolibacterium sp.]|nr:YqgE/AlgH family protein [Sterolibacterium sp.]